MYKETPAGLNHPDCVLQDVQIQADIYETLAKISTTHRYFNHGTANIEAVYIFPLPNSAVLLDMSLTIGDRSMTGQILPKKQAEDHYEDAVVEGDLPAMLQNPSPGIYTLNIANIKPSDCVTISFTYGLFLMWQGHDLRITIPATIATRYGDPVGAGLIEHQIPETDFFAENRYTLSIVAYGRIADAQITSPSHDIHIEKLEEASHIRLTDTTALMDRDFVLTITAPDMERSVMMWDRDGEKHLLWAGFHPSLRIESDTAPKGLVLVVDCSGSMEGDSINQARMAAKGILDSLRPQDYFNIVAFGSNHRLLFSSLRVANPSNIKEALKFAINLQADLGGTELEGALRVALGFSSRKTISQDIILITDGEVWNIDETINNATKGNRRIFSIGVGSSPAESLLKTLSAKTGGACEFVFPGESMTEKILRHVRRIYSPQIKGIETIWPATPEETFPELLQCVFDGDTVNMFAWFLERPESGNVGLLLTLSDGQTRQVSAGEVSMSTTCKTPGLIARMAAALRLADMTDSDAATELAVHYQLLSRYTHCLAIIVQAEAEKAQTLPELHKVKQMLAAGWGGSGRILYSMPMPMSPPNANVEYPCRLSDPCCIPPAAQPALNFPEFAERLNQCDIKSDTDLSSFNFFGILPPEIFVIVGLDFDCSEDDILTVFLHFLLHSDYGKHLNRNISRIIKKRFKQAKLSKDLVNRISDKILPILCQSPNI